jgi:hypothetical protein
VPELDPEEGMRIGLDVHAPNSKSTTPSINPTLLQLLDQLIQSQQEEQRK